MYPLHHITSVITPLHRDDLTTNRKPPLNLLDSNEKWMPVLFRDGQRRWISPTELANPDVVEFDADRPDFNGALTQFGIALIQTAGSVESRGAWRRMLDSPPDETTWAEQLKPWSPFFELDGPGARFMQDFELRAVDNKPSPVRSLLIEMPGESTVEKNADHFVKRHAVTGLCPHCAATALFTLQINAPSGGRGYRTSLRGGGPLTTLLVATATNGSQRSLWKSLWLNVLPSVDLEKQGDVELTAPHFKMPWMAPMSSIQSPVKDAITAPTQVHPLHVYWPTPHRVRLEMDQTSTGDCSVCRRPSDRLVTQCTARPNGMNYESKLWRHPLTPYYESDVGMLPVRGIADGIGYRYWLGLSLGGQAGNRRLQSATVIHQFLREKLTSRAGLTLQIWSFGYVTHNADALGWCDSRLPMYDMADCDAATVKQVQDDVSAWLAGAEWVQYCLRTAVKEAWFSKKAQGDLGHVDAIFWSRTEAPFYRMLSQGLRDVRAGRKDESFEVKQGWLKKLQSIALSLYDRDIVASGPIERQNPARVAKARNALRAKLWGPKLRTALVLPPLVPLAPDEVLSVLKTSAAKPKAPKTPKTPAIPKSPKSSKGPKDTPSPQPIDPIPAADAAHHGDHT